MDRSRETAVALIAIGVLALVARLLVLPFATTDGGDLVARTWIAWRWLSDPEFITHGVWGPLHFYLIGAAMALFPDPVYAPLSLHVVFGVVAPLLVYAFTRETFSSSRAALLVAAMYALYPVAIRNSVSVRAETIFVVFMLASMLFLAIARSERGRPIHAAGAGLALTLAAMLRYEGWMLIPFFGLLLWGKPRFMVLFGAVAMIHPTIWMIGNWREFGDPLYSINWASNWAQMGGADEPFAFHVAEAIKYPFRILHGMNLLVGLVAVAGASMALVTRDRASIWLVPLAGVSSLLILNIARGSLVAKLNYTLPFGTMLLPFAAVVFRRLGIGSWSARRFLGSALAVVGAIAILSGYVSVQGFSAGPLRLLTASSIPRVHNQGIALTLPNVISETLGGDDEGLISDFYGWGVTRYVALLTRLHPNRVFLAPGAPNADLNLELLSGFLDEHPRGVVILLEGSRFAEAIGLTPAGQAKIGVRDLALQPVHTVDWPVTGEDRTTASLRIFRYNGDIR